jgi:hypothetical protein
MTLIHEWADVLARIGHEQGGRDALQVVIYPCAPLQVLDGIAGVSGHAATASTGSTGPLEDTQIHTMFVFVISNGRSGSTLVHELLARHHDACVAAREKVAADQVAEYAHGINRIRTANSPTVTVASTTANYQGQVRADFPSFYWRLGETSGTTAADTTGNGRTGTYQSGVTLGVAGALSNDSNTAVRLSGTSSGQVTSNTNTSVASATSNPQTFSVEAWFRTTTISGGKLIGLGNSQTGTSSNYDRHIYMTSLGRLVFGVWTGSARTIISSARYNDGNWHHVVGTLSPAGLALYVDGASVGADPTTTTAQPYEGYWRVGGDNVNGWPSAPTSANFNGTVDEVAVYNYALPATSVAEDFNAR